MSARAAHWCLFITLALMIPLPMWGPIDALVPGVRYLILAGATAAVAFTEGAEGPVPAILLLLAGHALIYFALAWLCARIGMRWLAPMRPGQRRNLVLVGCAALLLLALAFNLYTTPFGRTPTGNLWGVLS
jgi:hypothetical protein